MAAGIPSSKAPVRRQGRRRCDRGSGAHDVEDHVRRPLPRLISARTISSRYPMVISASQSATVQVCSRPGGDGRLWRRSRAATVPCVAVCRCWPPWISRSDRARQCAVLMRSTTTVHFQLRQCCAWSSGHPSGDRHHLAAGPRWRILHRPPPPPCRKAQTCCPTIPGRTPSPTLTSMVPGHLEPHV